MTDKEIDDLPALAIAALNAASEAAIKSGLPRVEMIGDGLYRISGNGEKELIRMLPPRVNVAELLNRPEA